MLDRITGLSRTTSRRHKGLDTPREVPRVTALQHAKTGQSQRRDAFADRTERVDLQAHLRDRVELVGIEAGGDREHVRLEFADLRQGVVESRKKLRRAGARGERIV